MLMEVLLGIRGVWDVADPGSDNAKKNNIVKGLLFQSILKDLVLQIKNLKTRKEMWKAIKTRNLGADRVKEARLQTLITKFKNLKMSDNDIIDACAAKLSGIASMSATLGEVMSKLKLVKKFLTGLLRSFVHIVAALEQVLDLKTIGFEDVVRRLTVYEERVKQEDKANDSQEKLLYTRTYSFDRNSNSSRGRGRGLYSRGRGRGCCDIRIRGDFLTMRNSCGNLLIKVPRSANRLYKAQLKVGKPYCLQANIDEESWLWHVRLGHIGFSVVNLMHKLAKGVSIIKHQDQVHVVFSFDHKSDAFGVIKRFNTSIEKQTEAEQIWNNDATVHATVNTVHSPVTVHETPFHVTNPEGDEDEYESDVTPIPNLSHMHITQSAHDVVGQFVACEDLDNYDKKEKKKPLTLLDDE
ncbi:ERD1/XPR1/SYG1 protein [Tanacetum coccineum]